MKFRVIAGLMLFVCSAFAAEPAPEWPGYWKTGFQAVQKTLHDNLQAPNAQFPMYHAWPSPRYQNVYLWDSAFISLVWLKEDPKIAKDVMRSIMHFQGSDGRISHVVEEYSTDSWTNPPLIAWAANRIAHESSDPAFAAEVYPKLKKFHDWCWSNRRLKSGLFFWLHSYESGIDNSQRFGARDESWFVDTTRLGAVDFSSYMAMDSLALVELARFSHTHEDDVAGLEGQAKAVQQLIREKLWDEQTGYFYDRNEDTGELVKIPSIASVFPLVAQAATPVQAKRLIEHLRNPAEFNTKIPFPTVSRNDPRFEKDCWRGPVWVNTAYLALSGLELNGEHALAKNMALRLVDGVYKTYEKTGKLVEYYDPDRNDFAELSRKRGTGLFGFFSASHDPVKFFRHLFMKQIFLGRKPVDHFVGWTGLVNNLALDYSRP